MTSTNGVLTHARADSSSAGSPGLTRALRLTIYAAWIIALVGIPLVIVDVIGKGMIDLNVYRDGGHAWLDGIPLYANGFGERPGAHHLPFTYPPFAAILFSGLSVIGGPAAQVLIATGSILAITFTSWLVLRRMGVSEPWQWPIAALASLFAWAIEPDWATLGYGQVNLLLMALVAVDCLAVRVPRWRGVLVGVAAAVKLTPAVFVLFFLFRRDYRAVANGVIGFAVCSGLAWLLSPKDSRAYWFDALLNPNRPGGLSFARNQSIRGVLHRLRLPAHEELLLWALASIVVVSLAWLASRRSEPVALVAVAFVGLLVSPISWDHHWVWVVPAELLIGWPLWTARAWAGLIAAAGFAVVFVAAPFYWLPSEHGAEMHWTVLQNIAGGGYVWVGFAALIWLAFGRPDRRSDDRLSKLRSARRTGRECGGAPHRAIE
ncbi:glycosyltransferase 87 family protein [Skermania sp. ID1734]|uniref:glycosyltransferase 87 family protein n=1 Tax=Skermania sp. ID1734 TaxID=2597516 RepID=UPI00163D88C4|nr:glycosyltransferase 87 family protein [Skermania sp. ID1734]